MSAAKDRIIKQQQETIRRQLIAINELKEQLNKTVERFERDTQTIDWVDVSNNERGVNKCLVY